MKLIIEDDQGDQYTVDQRTIDSSEELVILCFDYTFFCEICQLSLLLSKISSDPHSCAKCLSEEYRRK